MAESKFVSRKQRLQLYLAAGFRCLCCAKKTGDIRELTIDHIVARANGGTHELSNLTVMCRECNSRKRDMSLFAFLDAYHPEMSYTGVLAELKRREHSTRSNELYAEQLLSGNPNWAELVAGMAGV